MVLRGGQYEKRNEDKWYVPLRTCIVPSSPVQIFKKWEEGGGRKAMFWGVFEGLKRKKEGGEGGKIGLC